MPLKLDLAPGERIIINGAVIKNGNRRSALVLLNKAQILRERLILSDQDVNTPAKRVYFPVQLMYLDPENFRDYTAEFTRRAAELAAVLTNEDAVGKIFQAVAAVGDRDFYRALILLRDVMDYEQTVLAPAPAEGTK